MPGFGNSFKSAREAQDLTLEKIAQETRINTRFLRAIEDEAFHMLPGGVFNRGFIRTYAQRVGLDPEKAVAEYSGLTTEVAIPELDAIESPSKRYSDSHVMPIAVGGLVVLIVMFYVFFQDPAPSMDTGERLDLSEGAATLASRAPNRTPGATSPTPTAPSSAMTDVTDSFARPTTSTSNEEIAIAGNPDDGVRIQLQVHDTTWISVQSDGEEVVEVELGPGTSRSFAAQEAMDLTIGNAGGLTLYINGEQARDLGGPGRVREFHITPSNFRRYTGS